MPSEVTFVDFKSILCLPLRCFKSVVIPFLMENVFSHCGNWHWAIFPAWLRWKYSQTGAFLLLLTSSKNKELKSENKTHYQHNQFLNQKVWVKCFFVFQFCLKDFSDYLGFLCKLLLIKRLRFAYDSFSKSYSFLMFPSEVIIVDLVFRSMSCFALRCNKSPFIPFFI